jgi:hypothetical protein
LIEELIQEQSRLDKASKVEMKFIGASVDGIVDFT